METEGVRKDLRKIMWVLVLLIAFLCGFNIVTITMSVTALKSSERQVQAITRLNASLEEVQRSLTHLADLIKELSESEEESDKGEIPTPWDGRI